MATTKNETMKPNDETTLSSFLNNWFSIPRPRDREDPWMSSAWPTAAKRPFNFQTTTTSVTVVPWNSWNPDHLLFLILTAFKRIFSWSDQLLLKFRYKYFSLPVGVSVEITSFEHRSMTDKFTSYAGYMFPFDIFDDWSELKAYRKLVALEKEDQIRVYRIFLEKKPSE